MVTEHMEGRKQFTSVIKLLNDLDIPTRNANLLQEFKQPIGAKIKPLDSFNCKSRCTEICLKLHLRCSSLNDDMLNIIANASYSCGYPTENSGHYFLFCNKCTEERRQMFHSLSCTHIDINTSIW